VLDDPYIQGSPSAASARRAPGRRRYPDLSIRLAGETAGPGPQPTSQMASTPPTSVEHASAYPDSSATASCCEAAGGQQCPIHIAPSPRFVTLDRSHHWMPRGLEVGIGMAALRGITTPDGTACQTHPQVHPACAAPLTVGTDQWRTRCWVRHVSQVRAPAACERPLEDHAPHLIGDEPEEHARTLRAGHCGATAGGWSGWRGHTRKRSRAHSLSPRPQRSGHRA
jgi:hypothetical protein